MFPLKYTQDNVMRLVFPDFSPATTTKRKTFNPVLKKITALCLQPFLTYLVVIKLRHKGEQMMFDSPEKVEYFVISLSQKTYSAALQSSEKATASVSILSAQRGKSAMRFQVILTALKRIRRRWLGHLLIS